jgi:hypothetical protein
VPGVQLESDDRAIRSDGTRLSLLPLPGLWPNRGANTGNRPSQAPLITSLPSAVVRELDLKARINELLSNPLSTRTIDTARWWRISRWKLVAGNWPW